jgi:hypothetical protein
VIVITVTLFQREERNNQENKRDPMIGKNHVHEHGCIKTFYCVTRRHSILVRVNFLLVKREGYVVSRSWLFDDIIANETRAKPREYVANSVC